MGGHLGYDVYESSPADVEHLDLLLLIPSVQDNLLTPVNAGSTGPELALNSLEHPGVLSGLVLFGHLEVVVTLGSIQEHPPLVGLSQHRLPGDSTLPWQGQIHMLFTTSLN